MLLEIRMKVIPRDFSTPSPGLPSLSASSIGGDPNAIASNLQRIFLLHREGKLPKGYEIGSGFSAGRGSYMLLTFPDQSKLYVVSHPQTPSRPFVISVTKDYLSDESLAVFNSDENPEKN